jgi:hypothetical protein
LQLNPLFTQGGKTSLQLQAHLYLEIPYLEKERIGKVEMMNNNKTNKYNNNKNNKGKQRLGGH